VVSKCPPALKEADATAIVKAIAPLPHQQVFFTCIHYTMPYNLLTREPVMIGGKNIILVCGIARPEPLIAFLKANAADVHTLTYSDHHYFVSADLEEIHEAYNNWNVQDKIIVTTDKDAARLYLHLDKLQAWGITIAVLPIEVKVMFDKGPEFDAAVMAYTEKTVLENIEIFGPKI
jgi:tetraacyldisaccharide 4'-kinase